MVNNRYTNYNDYELLYLIGEGSELAYNALFNKYDSLIYKAAARYYPYGDKMMDLVQEGRMVLFHCMEKYRDDGGASFFSYFKLSLDRKLYNLIRKDGYYMDLNVSEDTRAIEESSRDVVNIHKGYRYFESEIKRSMFDDCIINDMSIADFASLHGIKYHKAYQIYNEMISSLKRTFSID